jgi:serine/threonine protein kinase
MYTSHVMVEAAARSERLPRLVKYDVLEEIGHGGMATVYRARDRRLGREVAVKVIHPHLRDSSEVVSRFNAEARAVAKLHHPNIVEIFDVSEADEPEQYLVAELVRGTTLRKLLQKHGALPPEVAAAIALELLGALAHAHASGVVHRDIKPENVLIEQPVAAGEGCAPELPDEAGEKRPDDERRVVVKLTDFGIAKLLDAQGVTSTGQVLGSPAHMAPEQIEGGDVDGRADVFGLGVLLYECMVGHLPFEGNNPAQVLRRVLDGRYPEGNAERPAVGARWSKLLDRALARAPADRFVDANAMRDGISAELERLGVSSSRRELETWLDEPDIYAKAHGPRMIDKLCALADEARKRGEVLSAASDYNRALAHAPDDPRLLRIVAGLNRARALANTLRRAGGAAALVIGLGAATFGVGRYLRGRPAIGPHREPGPPSAVAPTSPEPSGDSTASSTASSITTATSILSGTAVRKPDRSLTLDLKPPMGVSVAVDTQLPRQVTTGDKLTMDAKAHTLTFTCSVCSAVRIAVAAADRDDTLIISVPIKPATLVVEGDLAKTYQILQHPELTVRAGANTVPLKSAFERVDIKQIETGTSVPARLEAGKTIRATFD